MRDDLQKKIDRTIRFIRSIYDDEPVEVAYSGGKDSDVILELVKMAGINYRAIYKNTTIDPPGTIKHCLDNGVEILRPETSFFKLIEKKGFPSRNIRFCCEKLKEYKVLDRCILGVRREESVKRAKRYSEPEVCRVYSKTDKTKNAWHYYPLLDWTNADVSEFISERNIRCHPLYYDESGMFHPERRLGCMCCPLASRNKRIEQFKMYPNMVKAYIRAESKYLMSHPNSPALARVRNVYEWFVLQLYCDSYEDFRMRFGRTLFSPPVDCKKFLEEQFFIKL